jgi:hypothetical protein
MSETTALAIAQEYPQDKFNLLIPVKTMQEISPLHKLVINEVQISTQPAIKDTYKEKNGELAITKKGLMKLMAAANIQVIESKPIPTQRCNKCIEIAQRTKQAPKCFECPYIDDVAYQVTIAIPEPSGTYRMVRATKEIRMEDAKDFMTEAQFKQFKPFRTEQCESKALNRALREGLMLKSSYKEEELKKPFAVALVMPNMSDPDMKRAMINRYADNSAALYGDVALVSEQPALPSGEVIIVDADDDEIVIDGEITLDEIAELEVPEPDPLLCDVCGKAIEQVTDKKGTVWTVPDLVDLSMGHFNQVLCPVCYKDTAAKAKKAGGK